MASSSVRLALPFLFFFIAFSSFALSSSSSLRLEHPLSSSPSCYSFPFCFSLILSYSPHLFSLLLIVFSLSSALFPFPLFSFKFLLLFFFHPFPSFDTPFPAFTSLLSFIRRLTSFVFFIFFLFRPRLFFFSSSNFICLFFLFLIRSLTLPFPPLR